MDQMPEEIEITAPQNICDILQKYFESHGLPQAYRFIPESKDMLCVLRYADREIVYSPPLRLGKILDEINASQNVHNNIMRLSFGEASLDLLTGVLTRADGKKVSLTEKEVEILKFLKRHEGQIISKNDLLKDVWEYARGVETHTLETHIYRLRQKIETDAANPKILLTDENGYKIG